MMGGCGDGPDGWALLQIDSYSGPVDALTIAIIKCKIYIRYDEFVISLILLVA